MKHIAIAIYFLSLILLFPRLVLAADCPSVQVIDAATCQQVRVEVNASKCGGAVSQHPVKCEGESASFSITKDKYLFTGKLQKRMNWGQVLWSMQDYKMSERPVEVKKKLTTQNSFRVMPTVNEKPVRAPAAAPQAAVVPTFAPVVATPSPAPKTEAAPKEEPLKINGYIDFYYSVSSNSPDPVANPTGTSLAQPGGNIKYRAFDQFHNDMNVALAELVVQKKMEDVTAKISLDFGRTADVMSPTDEMTKHITQALISYNPSELSDLTITVGKMMTHIGYELMKSSDNWNYSRSIMYNSAAPFWHEGVSATYVLFPQKLTASLFLYNNNGYLYEDNKTKSAGFQLFATPVDGLTLAYNFLQGRDQSVSVPQNNWRQYHNFYGLYQFNEKFAMLVDMIYGTEEKGKANGENGSWSAYNLGAKYTMGSFAISPRYGYYDDSDAITLERGLIEQKLQTYTLTTSYLWRPSLETRLEFRQDKSDKDVFVDGSTPNAKDSQFTTTVSVMMNF